MNWLICEGDARVVLAEMPAASVQTCITSPPYYGLRSYGTAGQLWGGDPACAHDFYQEAHPASYGKQAHLPADPAPRTQGATCTRCGAWQGELGSEPTIGEYVAHLVDVFRAVRRVLRPDGTLWLNLGDSYSHDRKWGGRSGGKNVTSAAGGYRRAKQVTGLGEGQLLLMPARVALALQADGWIVRSEIIWHKLNPMPESVQDRPTKAHEQLYLFSVGRRYYYDAAAIAEPPSPTSHGNRKVFRGGGAYTGGNSFNNHATKPNRVPGNGPADEVTSRNARDVWSLASEGFPGSHFATFPTDLARRCILAGSRPGDSVLDPFSGAGTTVMTALRHGRRGIGIELNPAYCALSRERIVGDSPLFNRQEGAA